MARQKHGVLMQGEAAENNTNCGVAAFNFKAGHNAAPPDYTFRGKTFDDA